MPYTFLTPSSARAAEPRPRLHSSLSAETRRLLHDTMTAYPLAQLLDRRAARVIFSDPMQALCLSAKREKLLIEHLIIAIKEVWASMIEERGRLGDANSEVLSVAISVCIEEYFADVERVRLAD